jgi:hypothetical protein
MTSFNLLNGRFRWLAPFTGLLLLAQPSFADTYHYRVLAPKVRASVPPTVPAPETPPPPPRIYATWDPVNTGSAYTLSSDLLTTSFTRADFQWGGSARATKGLSSGKWYWEVARGSTASMQAIGVVNSSVGTAHGNRTWSESPYSAQYMVAYGPRGGFGWQTPNVKHTTFPTNQGDVLGFALDMDSGLFSIYVGCSPEPYAIWNGLSGTWYPVVGTGGGELQQSTTANFGASSFTCQPPQGYNAGVW